ncbi:DUF1134 domain-containing protein [Hyphomicrobium sp.]|uniref:DUF1134 domain-containing protein n=1 Tax=Hyphomicrobium sp. TaxID=82 RepID=UPI002E32CF52|nr:DUF1134 domain-containing protein [Hyphomicrobium sp.]HEX2843516.1 DUF1134 domain-containing protein [Hyphomicrobium sp.]
MSMRQRLYSGLLGLAVAFALIPQAIAAAETCSVESFGDAVDASASELRAFSAETQPKLKQKLAALRDAKKWTEPDFETKGLTLVHDKKLDDFDTQAGELLSKIDTLGSPEPADGAANTSCANLTELKAASSELMAVMRAKSAYLIAKIDREIGTPPAATPQQVAKTETAPQTPVAPHAAAPASPESTPSLSPIRKSETSQTKETPPVEQTHPAPPPHPDHDKPKEADRSSSWNTTTAQAVIPPPPIRQAPPHDNVPGAFEQPGVPYELPPQADPDDETPAFDAQGGGYSIDEIREATRGFFGTVSTSLASVIEHAFQKSGRPTAYVLGTEGGGAFLAGLRYGEGTLYLRSGGSQKVYWHGPSIGYDLGAEGSRTLFLIYQLEEPNGLFRRFTGVDGSAYLVGGVGMTLLKGGPVMMAPIRSGLGLRLGASIGYVRFTPRPTWNPF